MIDRLEDLDNEQEEAVEESKLAKWINPPKLDELKQDYTSAQSDHNIHVQQVNTWLDNLNVEGKAKQKNGDKRSNVVPKLIRKQAEWRYAALSEPFLSTDDLFNTDPVTFEDKKAAIQNGLILNNQFNTKINKTDFIDEYIRTAVDEGTVICRVGWCYEEESVEVEVDDFKYISSDDDIVLQKLEALHELMQSDPITYTQTIPVEQQTALQLSIGYGLSVIAIKIGSHTEVQTKVIKNHPTVEVCSYEDVIIDPTCYGVMDDAKFVIFRFETSLSDLKAYGKYSNLNEIIIPSDDLHSNSEYRDTTSFTFKDKPREKIVAYEYCGYWDIDNTGLVKPIIVTWVGETIIRMEELPFPDKKLPYVKVQYLPVRKSVYGEPDGALLEDNQAIIGAVTRGMIDIMGRSASSQIGSRKDALDTINRKKFNEGKDYEYNPGVTPNDAFYMHTYPEIPNSAQYMIDLQNMEAESLTGVKSFNQGVSGASLGNVAVGVRGALDAASKRELGILRRLADGIIQIGRKFTAMNAEWLSEEEVIRITNEEFVTIRRDDLVGSIDIKLSISTAEADEQKAQELSFMLQTMGNTMPQGFSQMLLAEIATLRKMPTLAKKIERYVPQPDPFEEQMKQLQLQLLQAQVANEQGKSMESQGDAMLAQAKAVTEQAKAKMLDASADKVNLDFIEQESGIAHKRDVDKIQSQARGNIALEQAKAPMDVDKKMLEHQLNLQNKVIDHTSAMEQLKAKPKPTGNK